MVALQNRRITGVECKMRYTGTERDHEHELGVEKKFPVGHTGQCLCPSNCSPGEKFLLIGYFKSHDSYGL